MSLALLRVVNVARSFDWRDVFRDISFTINKGERTAMVGANGVGKTTLARIVAGLDHPTAGIVEYQHERVLCGYVPQDPNWPATATPRQVLAAERERLGAAARADDPETLRRFHLSGVADLACNRLSGGQKTRLALARASLSLPDLLILDEPTNHLDHEGLTWLEEFIAAYPHTVLVISHDRYFLDQVVTRVLEMLPDGMREYVGNYSAYRRQKEEELLRRQERYEAAQKEIRRIEAAIDRQMRWFKQAHDRAGAKTEIRAAKDFYRAKAKKAARRAQATAKRLERMKKESGEKPRPESGIALDFAPERETGRRLYLVSGLAKAYDRLLFAGADFSVLRGDRIGVIGANGAGKTTLLRLLLGLETPTAGEIWRSPSLKPAYLEQEMRTLNLQESVLASLLGLFPSPTPEIRQRIRHLLASFLFGPDDIEKPLQALSMGEKRRVALIRLLLSQYNCLLLDEPTNHLDLPAREKLEEAMLAYEGSLIIVSHDRYLIDRVCTKILAISAGRIEMYPGTYTEYKRRQEARGPAEESGDAAAVTPAAADADRLVLENRLAWLSAQLGAANRDPEQVAQWEAEFFAIGRALRDRHR